jgi:zinc transport system permease protein
MTNALEVSQLTVSFGARKILDDLSFAVLALALTVALGLRYLGVLLMGSLIIIPATTAKHLARRLSTMQALAVAIAMVSTLVGWLAAPVLHRETGPLIITTAALIFFGSLVRRGAE